MSRYKILYDGDGNPDQVEVNEGGMLYTRAYRPGEDDWLLSLRSAREFRAVQEAEKIAQLVQDYNALLHEVAHLRQLVKTYETGFSDLTSSPAELTP